MSQGPNDIESPGGQIAFADVFMDAPAGLALISLNAGAATITAVNRAFARMLETKATDFGAVPLSDLMTAEHYSEIFELLEDAHRTGRALSHEIAFVTMTGRGIVCDIAISVLTRAQDMFIMTAEDVTDRRSTEEELMEAVSLQQRADFIATLTHDLKTPIIGSNMVMAALLDGTLGELSDEQSQIIAKLKTSNEGLLKMIQNLLEVYRYASGNESLLFNKANIVRLVRDSVDDLLPLIENKQLSVEVITQEEGLELVCDQFAIKRVIANLLVNSLKFTPCSGSIKVLISRVDDNVVVAVQDTGPGIDPRDRHRLFQRFWQGQSGRTYAAGTGLGLYFCYQVIKAHGGKISCDSALGQGTTFTITLPQSHSFG